MVDSLTRATSILRFCPGRVGCVLPARGMPVGETLTFLTTSVKIASAPGIILIWFYKNENSKPYAASKFSGVKYWKSRSYSSSLVFLNGILNF